MSGAPRLLCIVGVTASGKSSLAMALAEALPAGILSVDSMQVYRGFDIGTATPSAEHQARVAHFGIDLVDPSARYSAGEFLAYARETLQGEGAAGRPVIAVGGTGLYLRALLHGLGPQAPADPELRATLRAFEEEHPGGLHARLRSVDPEAAARLHPHDLVRVERALEVHALTGVPMTRWQDEHRFAEQPFDTLLVGLRRVRDEQRVRIRARLEAMFAAGWIEEVAGLLASGVTEDVTAMGALGYRDIVAHLRGECDRAELLRRIERDSMRFARRQATWFNRAPSIHWLEPTPGLADRLLPLVRGFLDGEDVAPQMESL